MGLIWDRKSIIMVLCLSIICIILSMQKRRGKNYLMLFKIILEIIWLSNISGCFIGWTLVKSRSWAKYLGSLLRTKNSTWLSSILSSSALLNRYSICSHKMRLGICYRRRFRKEKKIKLLPKKLVEPYSNDSYFK